MSDTVFTDINPDAWTQVSIDLVGFVTNAGDHDIIYVEAASLPPVSLKLGHTLHPKEARTYNLIVGQQMYARTIQTVFPVTVTPGLGFGELGPFFRNIEQTIFPSASRTASVDSADIINSNFKGAHFIVDVSDLTDTPFITVTIQGKDPISGNYYDILISNTVNLVDTFLLRIYPGAFDSPNVSVPDILPNTFRVRVANGNSDPITYSISVLFVI